MNSITTPRAIALASALLLGTASQAATLERAQDLDPFYFGQSGIGVQMDGTSDTDFGTMSQVFDDGASMRWDGSWTASVGGPGSSATVNAYHSLSLLAGQNPAGETDSFLVDAFATLDFWGERTGGASTVSVGNDGFAGPAYADVWLRQSFRILPSAGEAAGDPVRVTVSADFFPGLSGIDPRWTGGSVVDGLPGETFRILHNGSTLYDAGGPVLAQGTLYSATFAGRVGDVITFMGPTLLSRLAVDEQSFGDESWSTGVNGGFFAGVAVAAVPEAGTWSTMMLGLVAMGAWVRRRRAAR